jgi:RNA recognition motif-containing protein
MNIYIGNLDYGFKDQDLRELFEEVGEVATAKIITDRATGRSKGFGFVEMPNDNEASNAIESLNGKQFNNRSISVTEARPRTEERGNGGGNGNNYRSNNRY